MAMSTANQDEDAEIQVHLGACKVLLLLVLDRSVGCFLSCHPAGQRLFNTPQNQTELLRELLVAEERFAGLPI
jgi:hypothetical protein